MKVTSNLGAVFLGLVGILTAPMQQTNGQDPVNVVVPNTLENFEGNSGAGLGQITSTDGIRYQAVFDASQFSSVPGSEYLITAILNRPDGAITMPFTTPAATILYRLSITDLSPGQLSSNFAGNIGTNETIVYEGEISFSSDNLGPPGGPKEFDYGVNFQTPFPYDPSEGNLLLDLTVFGTTFEIGQDLHDSPTNPVEWVFAGRSNDTLATARGRDIAVLQFVFVPEPVSSGVEFTGMLGFLVLRRRWS